MLIAKIIISAKNHDAENVETNERNLGDFSFNAIPSIGDSLAVMYDEELHFLRVILVRHWPLLHPFEADPRFVNTQRKASFVEIITDWVGTD